MQLGFTTVTLSSCGQYSEYDTDLGWGAVNLGLGWSVGEREARIQVSFLLSFLTSWTPISMKC